MLDAFQTDLIAKFSLGFVASVTDDGAPAVSPKGTFLVLDDRTIAFGNIRSPKTIANLRSNSAVEVNFADVFLRKAVRVSGHATIHDRSDAAFEGLIGKWSDVWGDLADRIKNLVVIDITAASTIITPPYDDGATEEEILALYRDKYRDYLT